MKNELLLFFLTIFQLGFAQIISEPITSISRHPADSLVILDVRTPAEYAAGHLDDAINISWSDPDFQLKLLPLDKSKTVYVYCQKGGRSKKAAILLDSLGYLVIDLSGGFGAWKPGRK